jgi:hypothetical protein
LFDLGGEGTEENVWNENNVKPVFEEKKTEDCREASDKATHLGTAVW